MYKSLLFLAIGVVPLVAGHCKITAASGDLGGKGTALGITANDGNSESDVTVFSGTQAKTFGDTPGVRYHLPVKPLRPGPILINALHDREAISILRSPFLLLRN